MKQYTNEERFAALNRHRESLHISKQFAFSFLTQHIFYKTIEEFADMIIHFEKLNEIYGEPSIRESQSELYKKRKEVFFTENRILTKKESEYCILKEREYNDYIERVKREQKNK